MRLLYHVGTFRSETQCKKSPISVVGDFFSSDFLGSNTEPGGSKDVIVLKLTLAGNNLVYGSFIEGILPRFSYNALHLGQGQQGTGER